MVAVTASSTKDKKATTVNKKVQKTQQPRLYTRGTVLGFRRSRANQYENISLVKIEGVNCREDAEFYSGKKIAYIYKAKTVKKGSKYRCIWGKVRRAHGSSGVVRANFKRNLPPQSFGQGVRVFMYPSNI